MTGARLRIAGRGAACALALFFAGAPASADPASEALLGSFIAWVDASEEWTASVSIVRSEGADTIAEGIVFGRADPHVAISIEELRLSRLAERSGGGFTAADIGVSGGAIITEFMETTIPSATMAEVSLPSLAGLSFDIRQMMTSIARFYSLAAEGEIEQAAIPEMTIVQRQPGVADGETLETRAVYRNLSFGPLAGGIIESQRAGPLSIAGTSSSGPGFTMEIGSVIAERMDVAGMAHVLDETQYRDGKGDGIWRPLLSRAGYSGLTGEGPDGATFRIGEVVVENIDGRQPEDPFTKTWDGLINPAVPQEAKNDLALEALTGMVDAWRLGTLRLSGISAQGPAQSGSFSLESGTVTGVSSEKTDSVILKTARLGGPHGFLSFDTLELAGFVPPDLSALMQFGALETDVSSEQHEAAIRALFAALPRIAHFGLHGVAAGKSEADQVTLERFTVDLADWNDLFAQSTDVRIDGLSVPAALLNEDPQTAEFVEGLGLDPLVLGFSFADRWSGESGVDSGTFGVRLEGAAGAEFTYRLAGVTTDWLFRATATAGETEGAEEALNAMLDELKLEDASLKLTDQTLLDQAFGLAAKKQGLAIEGSVYRQQMRAALPFLMATVLPADFAKKMSPPLQEFLEGGRTLIAELAPAQPVGVLAIAAGAADPLALSELLKLTLRTEPAQ